MNRWIDDLLAIADRLPTGRIDPRAGHKRARECEERRESRLLGDRLNEIIEAGDEAYYLAKCVANGLLTEQEATCELHRIAAEVDIPADAIVEVAKVKMGCRARPGNPKDKAFEAAAVERRLKELRLWQGGHE